MLSIDFIREQKEAVLKNIKNRRMEADLDQLLTLDEARRELQGKADDLRSKRKKGSKGKPTDEEKQELKKLGEQIKKIEQKLSDVEQEWKTLLLEVPNMTHPDAPIGGEKDFATLETVGDEPTWDFAPKDHEELLTNLDLIDFERAAKVAGAKFYYTKGKLVQLNQALLQFGIDTVTKHGFRLVETPDLVREAVLEGAGFNPRGEESQIYRVEGHDLNLIGTAEISMLGYHADEVLDLSDGPLKYAALSHCFRTEAGAYGRASKGLYRVHQFTKLELFIFCTPEQSEKLHKELLSLEKEICDALEIPYRVIDTPTADLGAPAYRKYDIEAWMTMNEGYGEITSTSNCTDYQARRMNIKYVDENGKKKFVHTLNGTAIVTSRFPIAIVENGQQKDGSVALPKALHKYLPFTHLEA